jgi:hypothetical protein
LIPGRIKKPNPIKSTTDNNDIQFHYMCYNRNSSRSEAEENV